MNKLELLAALCGLALVACSESTPGTDASVTGADAAKPGVDAGAGEADTGTSGADVGSVSPDAAAQPPDAGSSPADVGTAPVDASTAAGPDASAPTEVLGRAVSPLWGSIVFNEVLIDGTTEGDPNRDGDANPVEDQFVELVNASAAAVSMTGFTLVDLDFPDLPRHTFATFSLGAGKAAVVFGGGSAPAATASTTFFSANAADPGLPFGLHLASPADAILLLDGNGKVVSYFCYGGTTGCPLAAPSDESMTRSPDVTGAFVSHKGAAGANGAAFSAGTRVDGAGF